jgi:hypothetical protein
MSVRTWEAFKIIRDSFPDYHEERTGERPSSILNSPLRGGERPCPQEIHALLGAPDDIIQDSMTLMTQLRQWASVLLSGPKYGTSTR